MDRKLSAIVAGDIVGYARLMSEQEASVHGEVRSVFSDVIMPAVEAHGGTVFKTTGDGFLAAFVSVNEAIDAAVRIRAGFADKTLDLRLGINLGDVIEENGDYFGDGVNVASRLESIAHPGSIYVSEAVVRTADRGRSGLFRYVGRQKIRGLAEPIAVYAVRGDFGRTPWRRRLRFITAHRRRIPFALGAAVLLLTPAFAQFSSFRTQGNDITSSIARLVRSENINVRPTVAVLPFDNMSGDADQDYFTDGLTEDIIANLAVSADLQVIARNSSFALRGQAEDVRAIGTRLGARYVVVGSARRSGDQLRVVAQLADAETGAQLWSRTYDRRMEDLFAMQTELTSEIVAHTASYVHDSESRRAAAGPPESLQAYDLLLRARQRYRTDKSVGALRESRALLQQALELEPAYAAARAGLAMTYLIDVAHSVSAEAGNAEIETGLSEARQAVRLDPNLAAGYQALSFGLSLYGDFASAIDAAEHAVALNPNDPDSLMTLAKAQVRFGAYEDAVRNAERARRLHPLAPEYYIYVHGQALYAAGRLDEAEQVLQECLMRAPREADCLLIQAAAQSARGSIGEARDTMARLTAAAPEFSLSGELTYRRFGESPLMDRFLSQLANAGAPITS